MANISIQQLQQMLLEIECKPQYGATIMMAVQVLGELNTKLTEKNEITEDCPSN